MIYMIFFHFQFPEETGNIQSPSANYSIFIIFGAELLV